MIIEIAKEEQQGTRVWHVWLSRVDNGKPFIGHVSYPQWAKITPY
jgi:hypothetical protein